MTADDRVLFELDPDKRIATITLNNPAQRNSYDAAMRETLPGSSMWSPRTTTSRSCCCAGPKGCSPPVRT